MKLQQLVAALDAQVAQGDLVGAFQKYAANNCVTFSNENDKTNSKAQKVEVLTWFVDNMAAVNRIELIASQVVNDNVTESQFVFDFTNRQGQPLVFREVIRRNWENNLIVSEQYLMNATLTPVVAKQNTATAAVAPKADKKAAAPKADQKPATKSANTAAPAATATGKPANTKVKAGK